MGVKFIGGLIKTWELIVQLSKREVFNRYRGSKLGLAWTAINPLIMLSIYTLVFSQIFNARWETESINNGTVQFGLNLYCGLNVFNVFSEVASKAPMLITGNPNYVKKVVFPLHTLGVSLTISAAVHSAISLAILSIAKLILEGRITLNLYQIAIAWIPLYLGCLVMAWLISTIAVFARDIEQIINAVISMTMFLSPIFYPKSALPEKIQWIATINPLASVIENSRKIIMNNERLEVMPIIVQITIGLLW